MSKRVPVIKPTNPTRPRNAFDLSQKHLFTAPVGLLQPVMSLDLIPHDHVEIQADDFMRALPMNTAAFVSLRGVYEFFFVPYSQLWHPFDQFVTGMSDYRSSSISALYGDKSPELIPSVRLSDVFSKVAGSSAKDIFGFPAKNTMLRYMDMMGYGRSYRTDGSLPDPGGQFYYGDCSITAFRALAFQKIYSDFYRNNTYEPVDVSYFNIDNIHGASLKSDDFLRFLTPRYRNAQLDFFTNIRPKALFDFGYVPDQSFFQGDSDLTLGTVSSSVDIGINKEDSGSSSFSVADIRNAFALDKLLSVTMRSGKTYAEQVAAHFGYHVSEGRDTQVMFIGGFDSDYQTGDVTQQSGTSITGVDKQFGGYLGRTVGKMTGSGSGSIKFDAKEHGVLMCVYSIVPDMQYDSSRLDPFVIKNRRGNFFVPEFENLGMQPLESVFVSASRTSGTAHGWQPRYSEYKTALDINHGQFCHFEPLEYWSIGRGRSKDTLNTFNLASLKINPLWLNDVFVVNYNGSERTDQFFGGCNFRIQKVSDMSEDGMPRV